MDDLIEGKLFETRKDLANSGVHKPLIAGIAGDRISGAYSVVLSGGYEDDEDYGAVIIYTGAGGRDDRTGKQIKDQELTGGNAALAISKHLNKPINVVRGAQHKSQFSPAHGYIYSGKFLVVNYWREQGKSGHIVYRYRLEKEPVFKTASYTKLPKSERRSFTVERIIRDTKLAQKVKALYRYKCQVCRNVISLPLGVLYAEGAHIQPLGRPHEGPDVMENILCLCPNHHIMFDNYVFTIEPGTKKLLGIDGYLFVAPNHNIGYQYLTYHKNIFGESIS